MKSSGGVGWLWGLLLGGLGGMAGFCASNQGDLTNAVSVPAAPEMTVSQQAAPGDSTPEEVDDNPVPSGPSQDSPYQAIMGRNAFGLRPIPPPAPPPEVPVNVIPSALKLTGITTLIGKRAMFLVQEPSKKEAVYSDLLREGDKDGSITNLEVLHIDDLTGEVKVVYGGKEMTLNFAQNGIQPPVGAAPTTAPGAVPGAVPGRPGAVATVAPPPFPGQQPTATVTTAQGLSGASATFPPGISGAGSSGLRSIPTRPTRLGGGTPGSSGGVQGVSNVPEAQPVFQGTPEQQLQTIVEQSTRLEHGGIPMPPVPGGAPGPGGNLDPNFPPAPPALPY
jgi:hypothetical protein